jgi:hypothetical protein
MSIRGGLAMMVLLVVAVMPTAPTGAQAPAAEIEVSPTTAGPGSVVIATGSCPFSGDALLRAFLPSGQPGSPYDFGRTVPLVFDSAFTAQVVIPADAPPGTYTFGVACFAQDIGGPSADTQLVITDDDPPPKAADPTVTTISPVSTDDRALISGSCPPSTPAANRILIQDSVPGENPSPEVFNTIAPIDPDGRFTNLPLSQVASRAGRHTVDLYCLADELYLGVATTEYEALEIPDSPVTTVEPPPPPSPGGDAAPAQPVPGVPTLTG